MCLVKKMVDISKKNNDAQEVLKKRYAEGSISQEEYIRMKDEINT